MSVLVTGATGFIGRHLATRLLRAGECVRALVRPETDASDLAACGVEVIPGDVRDRVAVKRAVADCQLVYHLAKAGSSSSRSTEHSVNVDGTDNVGRAAVEAGVTRLVHASSVAVYGRHAGHMALHEDAPLSPYTRYGAVKALAEGTLPSAECLPVVIVRIASVLGPGTEHWRPIFKAVAARRFRMLGQGKNHQHTADVADIVEGLFLCGTAPNLKRRAYNLAGAEPIELRELIRLIALELGMGGRMPRPLPATPFRIYKRVSDLAVSLTGTSLPRADNLANLMNDRVMDISRARRELGYAPTISVSESIRRTAEWYRLGATAGRITSPDMVTR